MTLDLGVFNRDYRHCEDDEGGRSNLLLPNQYL